MSKKIIRTYVRLSFLFSIAMAFHSGTYQLFLASRGLDLFEINLVNMFFMFSVIFLQVPTGAFADVFGRKRSIIAGCAALVAGFFVYYLAQSFWIFVLAEMILALGLTLLDGAVEAWAVDSLAYHEYVGNMEQVFKRQALYSQAGLVIGSVAGGYVGNFDLAYPWILGSAGAGVVCLYALLHLHEHYREKKKLNISFRPIARATKAGLVYGVRHRGILYLVLFSLVLSFSVQALNMQWPFMFRERYAFSISEVGWVYAFISLSVFAGSWASVHFGRLIRDEKKAVILSQAITAIGIIGASLVAGVVPFMLLFLSHEFGRGIFTPLKKAYLNKRIESATRATVLSFESMVKTGGSFAGLLVSGYLAKAYSIPIAWLVSGVVLLVSILIFLNLKNGDE